MPRRGPGARRCCGGAGAARARDVVPGARGAEARGVRRPRRRDPARPGRAGRRRRSPHRCVRQWWRRRPRRGATGDPGAHRFDHRHEAVCGAVSPRRARCAPGGDPSARRRDLRQRQGRRGVDRRGARAVCAGRSEDAWRGACGNAPDPAPGGSRARSRTNRRACLHGRVGRGDRRHAARVSCDLGVTGPARHGSPARLRSRRRRTGDRRGVRDRRRSCATRGARGSRRRRGGRLAVVSRRPARSGADRGHRRSRGRRNRVAAPLGRRRDLAAAAHRRRCADSRWAGAVCGADRRRRRDPARAGRGIDPRRDRGRHLRGVPGSEGRDRVDRARRRGAGRAPSRPKALGSGPGLGRARRRRAGRRGGTDRRR